ncbi:MAG: Transcription factor zinc-finger [Verrucomicrobiota bacterium]|jgi:Zn-finger nucleic acid-binding protein
MSGETVQFCPRECGSLASSAGAPFCRACRGLWISQERMQHLLGMKINPQRVASLALDNPEPLLCPEDAEEMLRFAWKSVKLDYCPCCDGLWLDGGELELLRPPQPEAAVQVVEDPSTPEKAELAKHALDVAIEVLEFGIEHGKSISENIELADVAEGLAGLLSGLAE